MGQQRRILVIRNSALGDVAMTLPVLYSAARQYPDVEFQLLTRPFFGRLLIGAPANLHLIAADFKGEYKGVKGLWRLLRILGRYGFTDVADFHNVLRSWIIDASMLLRGKRVRMLDKGRGKRRAVMHAGTGANDVSAVRSYIQRYADVLARLGLPVEVDFKGLFPAAADCRCGAPKVGVAPFARYFTKTYPAGMMAQVVHLLTERGVEVYLFGAKGSEAEMLETWQRKYPGCTSMAGKMPIEEELAAMAGMDAMLTMDSANQHLAALAGVPVVSVWGGTAPNCGFLGYGQQPSQALCMGLPCQPCSTAGGASCPNGTFECMRSLQPERVVEKIMEIVSKKCV